MSEHPPAYQGSYLDQLPLYLNTSGISARWHIINTPAKGVYGSRGISLLSDQSAITVSGERPSGDSNYDIVFTDSSSMEVHAAAPTMGPSGSSSDKVWKTPVIANGRLSSEDSSKATITFPSRDNVKFRVDAFDLGRGIFTIEDVDPNEPRLVILYAGADTLPFVWAAEPNKDFSAVEEKPTETHPAAPAGNKKSSWMSKMKGSMKQSKPNPGNEAKIARQKQGLSRNFVLRDGTGNIFAKFTNELFTDASSFTKSGFYEAQSKQTRSWGRLDIHDPNFTAIRSAFPLFEKWSETDLELVILMSLMCVIEVNLKMNGGPTQGSAFGNTLSMMGSGDPRQEGLVGIAASGMGFLAQAVGAAMRAGPN